jgi:PD-(D/E)XK nuclease superfamily
MPSIFSLGRGDSLQETYLTKVFAFVLQEVPAYTLNLLEKVFRLDQVDIKVNTVLHEVQSGPDRPDIIIDCDKFGIPIENKIGAVFQDHQLSRYKERYGRVFLIYKYLSNPDQGSIADAMSTWYGIYLHAIKFLREKESSLGEVEKYILEQLKDFLKENDMGIERVEEDIYNGLRSLKNLHAEIVTSLEQLKIEFVKEGFEFRNSAGSSFYTEWVISMRREDKLRCCLHYNPLRLFSYYLPKGESKVGENLNEKFPDLGWQQKWMVILDFPFESFFNLNIEQQIDKIKEFISHSVNRLQSVS